MSSLDVCHELGQNFIDYAYAVNSDRAIPSAADGLKPVARRILWGMNTGKVFSDKAYKKCAAIVGDVMGKYHPHGDTSIYDTMVRLTQEWIMRYPLIDWHGNKGGITGDTAAAYRYTECRFEKLTEQGFLTGINKHNVNMQLNYSEELEEPVLLPAVFPNILCNPNQGIGLAMACEWLPHNLTEISNIIIEYLKTGVIYWEDLYPDFPTGGTIVNKDECQKIYLTGKGRVVLEGKYKEETRGNKRLLVFYEIPYQVYTEALLEQINDAYEKETVQDIVAVRDESGKKGLRIVIELSRNVNKDKVLAQLFAETDLRKSYSANQVALIGKTPTLLNLQQVIEVYVQHNIDCIKCEMQYDYDRTNERIEVLQGLIKALDNVDEVIKIIKNSSSGATAKVSLQQKFNFSDTQVQAILDMKLVRLSNLEKEKLEDELKEKEEYANYCERVTKSEDEQKKILAERLEAIVKEYGDDRRTEVTQKEIVKIVKDKKAKEVIIEDVVVSVNKDGYIKSIPVKEFKAAVDAINSFKTTTADIALLFSNFGKVYRVKVSNIKKCGNRDKGNAAGSIIKLDQGEKILNMFPMSIDEKHPYIVFFTKQGLIKKSKKDIYIGATQNLNGLVACGINDGDEILSVYQSNGDYAVLGTKEHMAIRFEMDKVNPVGKTAKGVKAINLSDGDYVTDVQVIPHNSTETKLYGKIISLEKINVQGRGGKGKKLC